jgi:hypothetical protein
MVNVASSTGRVVSKYRSHGAFRTDRALCGLECREILAVNRLRLALPAATLHRKNFPRLCLPRPQIFSGSRYSAMLRSDDAARAFTD